MFKLYRLGHAPSKSIPNDYHYIKEDPSYKFYSDALISKKENFAFDEIINCLKHCFLKADYLGCCSIIYWEYYKEFYDWIVESFKQNNPQNIRIIKKFYKKTLIRWVEFVKYSDDTMYPQNDYFRLMKKEIEKHLQTKLKLNDKQKKGFIMFSFAVIVLVVLNILAFTTCITLVKHNENNTYEVSGIVTDFEYVAPGYFGRKIRHPHIIHLDNGVDCVFHYLNYEMYYNDPNQEEIRDALEGQYVVIRLSKIDDSVITINTDEKCYLSFEASNMQHIVGTIGVIVFDLSVLFISYIIWINPNISTKKRYIKE